MRIPFGGFDYPQIIHLSVLIHIQVVDSTFEVVQPHFEFFQIAAICEKVGYSSQIQVVTDILAFGLNGNVFSAITIRIIIVIISVIVSVGLCVA